MKKFLIPVTLLFMFMSFTAAQTKSIYNYTVKDINGKDFNFSQLKGKKILIVNTASKCGFTPQYADLEKLYKEYKDKNLVIIGFPANDFMKQEPGTDADIKTFCSVNYGVTFPMMSKISVKGNDMAPVYKWLTQKELNGVKDSNVSWNFQKYLIDENGKLVDVIPPKEKPYSERILSWLNK